MSLDDLIKSLQQDYLASLPEKITRIQAQIETANTADLRESFHKLKGTGRTYGLPEVSQLAETVESICLKSPKEAPKAAAQAVAILKDIHRVRADAQAFALQSDSRYTALTKLTS